MITGFPLPGKRIIARMNTESVVAAHYSRGQLEEKILQAVAASGKDPEQLTARDLWPVDEFHVRGIESTEELAAQMELRPELRLLDVGCGIGGPARYFASEQGCEVTGIDLTEEFVRTAIGLTRRCKLEQLAQFRQTSALDLPFEPASFDRAYLIHVGMNIADKAGLCRQVHRVLKPGGIFAIFDIMRLGDGAMRYPVPWAPDSQADHVAEVSAYHDALSAAGFRISRERDHTESAIEFTDRMMARIAQSGPPPLGIHVIMGEQTGPMLGNVQELFRARVLGPIEMIAVAA
jgi:SAM-dependent methyltransferase